jgi:hypothetical protein
LSWCWHHSLLYNLSNGQFPFSNPEVELHILSVLDDIVKEKNNALELSFLMFCCLQFLLWKTYS